MKDLFGVPLHVGDKVVYTTGAQSNTRLEIGTILSISPNNDAILKSYSGRRLQLPRYDYELVAVSPISTQHPELFI